MEFSVTTIAIFVGMLNEWVKYIFENFVKKDVSKFIPIFSVLFGIGLGIIGYYMEGVSIGSNLIEAIFIGGSAGSSATCVHQIGKQLAKPNAECCCTCETDSSIDITEESENCSNISSMECDDSELEEPIEEEETVAVEELVDEIVEECVVEEQIDDMIESAIEEAVLTNDEEIPSVVEAKPIDVDLTEESEVSE